MYCFFVILHPSDKELGAGDFCTVFFVVLYPGDKELRSSDFRTVSL